MEEARFLQGNAFSWRKTSRFLQVDQRSGTVRLQHNNRTTAILGGNLEDVRERSLILG